MHMYVYIRMGIYMFVYMCEVFSFCAGPTCIFNYKYLVHDIFNIRVFSA